MNIPKYPNFISTVFLNITMANSDIFRGTLL